MKTKEKQTNTRIIATAIIWATVIIATALTLKGTNHLTQLLPILGGGASASIMTHVGSPKRA